MKCEHQIHTSAPFMLKYTGLTDVWRRWVVECSLCKSLIEVAWVAERPFDEIKRLTHRTHKATDAEFKRRECIGLARRLSMRFNEAVAYKDDGIPLETYDRPIPGWVKRYAAKRS